MGGLLARGQGGGPPPWGELGGGACDFASPHATHLAKSDGTKTHETGMVWACLVSIGRSIQALAEKWPGHLRILGPQTTHFPPLQAPNSMDSHGTSTMRLVMVWGCQLSILGRIGQVGSKQLGHSPHRTPKRYQNHHFSTHISAQTQWIHTGP